MCAAAYASYTATLLILTGCVLTFYIVHIIAWALAPSKWYLLKDGKIITACEQSTKCYWWSKRGWKHKRLCTQQLGVPDSEKTQVVDLPLFTCVIQITRACKFSAGPGDSKAVKALDLHSWIQQSDRHNLRHVRHWLAVTRSNPHGNCCPSACVDVISGFICTVKSWELNGLCNNLD